MAFTYNIFFSPLRGENHWFIRALHLFVYFQLSKKGLYHKFTFITTHSNEKQS